MNNSMQEIYTQIWNDNIQTIRAVCYAKLNGRREDAEDMVQNAFGLLWKKLLTGTVPPNPKAWLIKTVKNLSYEQYRSNAQNTDNISSTPVDEGFRTRYSDADVAQLLEQQEHSEALLKAFNENFTQEEKQIIIYDRVDGIPQAKISQLFCQKPGSTRVRIHRLKHRLQLINPQE